MVREKNQMLTDLRNDSVPPVRYLALKFPAGPPAAGSEIEAAHSATLQWPPLRSLIDMQLDDGSFPSAKKTKSAEPTFTAIRLMALCGLTIDDECVKEAVSYIEQNHTYEGVISIRGKGSGVLPCYVGIFGRVAADIAGIKHPLYKNAVRWITEYQRFDHRTTRAGGDGSWPYRSVENYGGCWKSVSCYHGVIPALRLLSATPAEERSESVVGQIDAAIEYLRIHRLNKKSSKDEPLFRYSNRLFLFGGYRTNVLDTLEGIGEADPSLIREPWVESAFRELEARASGGRIESAASYPTGLVDPFGTAEEQSHFLYIRWLRVRHLFSH